MRSTLSSPVIPARPSGPNRPLPPLPRAACRTDGLTPTQSRVLTGAILGLHVALVYGLLQVKEVRDAAREVAPMFVDLIAPPAPPAPPVPVPPPPAPQPVQKRALPPPVIAAAPSPAPAAFTVPEQPTAPVVQAAPEVRAAPALVAPPASAPVAPAPQPRVIPASEVEYLERPAAEYPRLSIRNGETGRVIVLVLIDERGLPQQVQVAKSSGFARLDGAALTAVRQSRFKPQTDNGRAASAWTNVPFDFGLEK